MAQLVARDIWDVDAAGSNPVTPTKNTLKRPVSEDFSLSAALQMPAIKKLDSKCALFLFNRSDNIISFIKSFEKVVGLDIPKTVCKGSRHN